MIQTLNHSVISLYLALNFPFHIRKYHDAFLDFLSNGMTIEEVLIEYPQIRIDDVRACIAYGAEMSRERFVEVRMAS